MENRWRFISPKELRDLIKSPRTAGKDYVVVDVRDDDFAGGNVKGCLRAPFRQYEAEVEKLVRELKDVQIIIFHCAFSQVRGPKSAQIYIQTQNALVNSNTQITQEVLVLQGGFAAFQGAYKDDVSLIEKWEKSIWEDAL